ncbi:ribosomal-protein-alanine acetyltransferase [Anaerocolumna cellulosilytica]|uniref:[Ribosomal protein bS18]-alanine N-acetyltransferase n=1 Tax=Anaerocolumna cellulosilytica TaxID=433286 RepID=A0A6S6RD09_9FIRM|nr:ribosomal protein S18-alanine N-acetyltransferase [Anaerocolumna cellulosilytica]MBB5195128.1 ribosomal-protein-alanine N-acetyltransferase [Anaerocolumna cellulosilytica]BCJ96601.1 ribosomal-protein-alanine acetyltransferase [Anaerocolumna cellulosilytica]
MENIIIRRMEAKDITAVTSMEEKIFSLPWKWKDFEDSIGRIDNVYLVAEMGSRIVGYCGMWAVAGEGQINNVAVEENSRHKGIAYTMLNKLLKIGIDQGLTAFTLEVRVSNRSAISVYQKLGFHSEGVRKNFYEAPIEDGMIMWLYVKQ